jgi:hypothetical protein
MIIFVDDDQAYLYWVTHHRHGFVLDGKRKPKLGHLVMHRATCQEIKSRASRHLHWTTGNNFKACCLGRTELEAWAVEETAKSPDHCPTCEPNNELAASADGHIHLSKLASDILEYVLEAALIHFEIAIPPYHLTVADIAACFAKTPGQISPALHHLLEAGFITVQGHVIAAGALPTKRVVLPTATAIRTLEAFQTASDSTIQQELAKLKPD